MITHFMAALLSSAGVVLHSLDQAKGPCIFALARVPMEGPLVFGNDVRMTECRNCAEFFQVAQASLFAQMNASPSQLWAVHREPIVAPLRQAFKRDGKPYNVADAHVKGIIDDLIAPTPWDIQRRRDVQPENLELLIHGETGLCDDVALMSELPAHAREFFAYTKILQTFLK